MRFLDVTFGAWGPFTNVRLDLSGGDHGLHLVFGPNEAGKSSALRGVRALLFGIDGRTPDAFRHEYSALRISASLRAKSGATLSVVRRKGKGTKNTLLDADGKTTVPEDALRPFLGVIGATLFETHFAMGHEDLVSGGQEILQGKGDVGKSLFSAAIGGGRLRELIEQLDAEADKLFMGRAQNPELNRALRDLDTLRRDVRSAALSVDDWRRTQESYDLAIEQRKAVTARLASARAELTRLVRLRDLLPKLDERRVQVQRREALGQVVLLPAEFGEWRRQALEAGERAQRQRAEADHDIVQAERELANLRVDQALIDAGAEIDSLYQALGNHRRAMKMRPAHLQRHIAAESEARRLLADLDPRLDLAEVERFRPSLALRTRIEALGTQGATLRAELKAARQRCADAEAARAKLAREFAELPPARDLTELESAIEAALASGKGADLASASSEADAIENAAMREIDRLGHWRGALEALERLALPSDETIARFEAVFAEFDRERAALDIERARWSAEQIEAQRQMAELVQAGAVPSEDELSRAREQRDSWWRAVRRAWLAHAPRSGEVNGSEASTVDPAETGPASAPAIAEAYEGSVVRADTLADRLRREADRVAARATAQARVEHAQRRCEQLAADEARWATRQSAAQVEWRAAWGSTGVEPRAPAEMRAFLSAVAHLRERAERLRAIRRQIADRERHLELLRVRLDVAVRDLRATEVPAEFASLLSFARRLAVSVATSERKRRDLAEQREACESRHTQAQQSLADASDALQQWELQLRETTAHLPLPESPTATEAVTVLGRLDQTVAKLHESKLEQASLETIDRDAARFQADSVGLAVRLAPELVDRGPDDIAERLHERRGEARERAVARSQTERRKADAVARRDDAAREFAAAAQQLEALCARASCSTSDELVDAFERSNGARGLDARIGQIDDDLAALGTTFEQADTEVRQADREQLITQVETFAQTLRDDEQRDRELSERIGALRNALEEMDQGAQALRAAEEEQATLARIRDGVEHYADLRLAARLLRHEIERFRAVHQDPMLARAGSLFARLTLGSFERLDTDFGEGDHPVLVGVRPTGARVHAEGMSAGTLDQLHLALRLAHLETQLASTEPVPLVLDDLLVHFDDERSAAALSILAELSSLTQVVLFTHHARLRDLAQRAGGDRVFLHELRRDSPAEACS